jgi:hypothetical protein
MDVVEVFESASVTILGLPNRICFGQIGHGLFQ